MIKKNVWKWTKIIAIDLSNLAATTYVLMFLTMGMLHLSYINDVDLSSSSYTAKVVKIMVLPAMIYVLISCILRLKSLSFLSRGADKDVQQSS